MKQSISAIIALSGLIGTGEFYHNARNHHDAFVRASVEHSQALQRESALENCAIEAGNERMYGTVVAIMPEATVKHLQYLKAEIETTRDKRSRLHETMAAERNAPLLNAYVGGAFSSVFLFGMYSFLRRRDE